MHQLEINKDVLANTDNDALLDSLVREIFETIPSYFDEDEAARVRALIVRFSWPPQSSGVVVV